MPLTSVKEGREGLIEATLRLIDRDGPDAVTLRAVGKEAQVSAPALYWHFEGKDELLDTIVKVIATQFVARMRAAAVRPPVEDQLLMAGGAFIDFFIEYPHRFQLLFRRPPRRTGKPLQRTPPPNTSFGVMVELVQKGITGGTLKLENPTSIALTVAALAQGLVLLYERNRFASKTEFADFARLSFERLLRGIAT